MFFLRFGPGHADTGGRAGRLKPEGDRTTPNLMGAISDIRLNHSASG